MVGKEGRVRGQWQRACRPAPRFDAALQLLLSMGASYRGFNWQHSSTLDHCDAHTGPQFLEPVI